MERSKIAFVSADFFADVDMPILRELKNVYHLTWYCVLKQESRYSISYLEDYALKNGITLRIILLKKRRRSLLNLRKYWSLFLELRFSGFDLVYFEYMDDPYTFVFSLFLSRDRKIYGMHDVKSHSNFGSLANRLLHSCIPYSFKFIQTFSKSQMDLLKWDIRKENCFVIPLSKKNLGITSTVRPNLSNNGIRLLFFGGIHSYKGLDILINSIEAVSKIVDIDFKLTIAGKGPDWERVTGLIKNEELYNLQIGFINTDEIPDLFNSHHFIMLPYRDVTQSGPLFDSFSFNLPAIVSDQPGFLEFVENGKTGFVFKTNSVDSLTELFLFISKLTQSDYNLILDNLCSFSERYNSSHIAKEYAKMFDQVIFAK